MAIETKFNVQNVSRGTALYLDIRCEWTTDPEDAFAYEDIEEAEADAQSHGGEVFRFERVQLGRSGFRLCSVSGCCKPHKGNGYCNAHYQRLRKHGYPMGGGTQRGEPLRFIHEVALRHTGDECLAWPFSNNSEGYGTLAVDGKTKIASRYVCELSHGAPPTPEHQAAPLVRQGSRSMRSARTLNLENPRRKRGGQTRTRNQQPRRATRQSQDNRG